MNASGSFYFPGPPHSSPKPLPGPLEFQPVKAGGSGRGVRMVWPKPPRLINFSRLLLLAVLPPPPLPLALATESGAQRLSLYSEKKKNVLSIHITRQCKCFQEPSLLLFMFFEPKNHLEKPCCSSTLRTCKRMRAGGTETELLFMWSKAGLDLWWTIGGIS